MQDLNKWGWKAFFALGAVLQALVLMFVTEVRSDIRELRSTVQETQQRQTEVVMPVITRIQNENR